MVFFLDELVTYGMGKS